MKSICITGAAQSDLQIVAAILQQSGMKQAKPAKRDETVDLALWHEQVLAQAAEESDDGQPISSPGRIWEQLASDIFIANIKSKVWGWADTHSTWLLDYWLGFEPHLYFVLVCVSPQQMLAGAMATETEAISVEAIMDAWQTYHQELLRFHHRNPQRSLLVDVHECAANPEALIEHCSQQWKLPLTAPAGTASTGMMPGPLALYLAQQLCQDYPHTASLQNELAATMTRLGEAEGLAATTVLTPEQLIADYCALHDRSAELQQVQAAHDELAAVKTSLDESLARQAQQQQDAETSLKEATEKNDLLLMQLKQVRKELEARLLDNETQQEQINNLSNANASLSEEKSVALHKVAATLDELTAFKTRFADAAAAHEQQRENLENKLSEASQENELLLLQLHQVQEELGSVFLRHESQQSQIDALTEEKSALVQRRNALQGEVAAITHARDEQARLAAERQARIDALTQERDGHANQAAERQVQINALTQSNATLSVEKSALAQRRDALQGEVAALTAARDESAKKLAEASAWAGQLKQERDAQANLAAERQAQIDQLNQNPPENKAQTEALSAALTKLKEAEQENELILLQLHQVQEELEHYFLQQQNAQKQLTSAEERWQRMFQRNPDFCDYESIEVLAAESSESTATRWRLKNLNAAGRSHPELEFKTVIEHGIAGFVLTREPGTTGPLARWPSSAADQSELMLLPAGTRADFPQRIENLLDLGTRDWDLLQALGRLLANALKTPAALKAPADFQPALLRNGLDKLRQIFEKFPATLRYDSVNLKREQVNPDYEHLWLRFENLAFGDKRWPEFEFRLSCANVRPNRFGTHPKLEFPEESSQAPFDAWFIESYDDFGAKLELRFALPESMDLAIWHRLSESDRAFLSALIKRLPAMLGALKDAGRQIKRPWDDWNKMVLEIQRVLALHTAPPQSPAPPVPMQPTATKANAAPPSEPKSPLAQPSIVKAAEKPLTKTASKTKAAKPVQTSKPRQARK